MYLAINLEEASSADRRMTDRVQADTYHQSVSWSSRCAVVSPINPVNQGMDYWCH